jgi:hypothetical protein
MCARETIPEQSPASMECLAATAITIAQGKRTYEPPNPHLMKTKTCLARVAATGSLLLLAACTTPPTVVTQTTTTTETTAVTRGNRVITPATTVVYPSTVRKVVYPSNVHTVAYYD